jgi:hypothetical protein
MTGAPVPVLWICGPPGVGKSTATWQLYTELAGSGVHVAFADTDQLCMCYPAPAGDPGRQHVKALNAAAVIRSFRSASPGEVERRFTAKHGHRDGLDELLREVRYEIRPMDASGFADARVDTTGVPAADVPRLIRPGSAST